MKKDAVIVLVAIVAAVLIGAYLSTRPQKAPPTQYAALPAHSPLQFKSVAPVWVQLASGLALALSRDGRWIAYGNSEGKVQVLDRFAHPVSPEIGPEKGSYSPRTLRFLGDSTALFVGGYAHEKTADYMHRESETAYLLDTLDWKPQWIWADDLSAATLRPSVRWAVSDDGSRFLYAMDRGQGTKLIVRDKDGSVLFQMLKENDSAAVLSLSADGSQLLLDSTIYDVATSESRNLGEPGVVFAPDGKTLLSWKSGVARLMSVWSGRGRNVAEIGLLLCGAFSDDGKYVVIAATKAHDTGAFLAVYKCSNLAEVAHLDTFECTHLSCCADFCSVLGWSSSNNSIVVWEPFSGHSKKWEVCDTDSTIFDAQLASGIVAVLAGSTTVGESITCRLWDVR